MKTEQRRKKSKATEGAAIPEGIAAQVNSIVETFNHKGKYNFVNRTSVETCIIQENQALKTKSIESPAQAGFDLRGETMTRVSIDS